MISGGTNSHRIKPERPKLNRNHPTASGLVFACAYGWKRGYTDRGAGDFGDRDEVTRVRGFWTLGAGGGQYQRCAGGWGVDNGDGATGDSSLEWAPSPLTRYDLPAQYASFLISIRPDAFSTNGQIPFFKRRPQPYGATEPGWCFTGAAANKYRFQYSDGVTNGSTLTSVTTQDAGFLRIDTLIVTIARSAANNQLSLYVNGKLEASATTAVLVGNAAATEAIKIMGLGPLNERFPGFSDVGLVWKRTLTNSEIMNLSRDRFMLFRGADGDRFAAADQSFLLSC